MESTQWAVDSDGLEKCIRLVQQVKFEHPKWKRIKLSNIHPNVSTNIIRKPALLPIINAELNLVLNFNLAITGLLQQIHVRLLTIPYPNRSNRHTLLQINKFLIAPLTTTQQQYYFYYLKAYLFEKRLATEWGRRGWLGWGG